MKYTISLFLLSTIGGCSKADNSSHKIENIDKKIIGIWDTIDEDAISCVQLDFESEEVTFFNRSDTIYTFQYTFSGNTLILEKYGNKIFETKILKLTKDSLVFESLLKGKKKRTYLRKKY